MNGKFLLINALNAETFNDCHIKGSINIPLAKLPEAAKQLDKNSEIVAYCASVQCPISRKAWHILHDLGFTNVRAYEGGMREWKKNGLPTEGPCKADYLTSEGKPLPEDKEVKTISLQELKKKLGI